MRTPTTDHGRSGRNGDTAAAPAPRTPARPGEVSARAMSQAVLHDPQFTVPVRPQLCRGLHIVETPSGVLIDGAAERQHLRGTSAAAVRAELLPLLDGSRDVPELARATGWTQDTVRDAVAGLYFAGLLEDGDAAVTLPPADGPSAPAAIWMSRTLDCSRVFPHSSHVARAAARAVVRHTVREVWRAPLRRALADLGIVDVAAHDPEESASGAVRVLDLASPQDVLDSALEACTRDGSRVLLVDERDGRIAVGPFIDPTATACLGCARSAVPHQPSAAWTTGAPPTPRDLTAVGLIAEELRALLLRGETSHALGGQFVVDLPAATTTVRKLTPEVDCVVCRPSTAGRPEPGQEAAAPLHYEHAVAFPPRHLINPKSHQHHFRPENVRLQFDRLRYPNNPRTVLPDPDLDELRKIAEGPEPATWPEALAVVLRLSVGLRTADAESPGAAGDRVRRWAPTGGNLGSPHAFPLLQGLPEIPDGVYYYDAHDHALTTMHPHTDHLEEVTAHLVAQAPSAAPQALVVLAADVGRVARKYGPFSYRVAHLDAGCALTQLGLAASLVGLDCRLADPSPWQPYRERLMGASGPQTITAVVHLISNGNGPCH